MGDLSDFERRQMVGAPLAGTSVTKTATYQERQFRSLCHHTRIMGRHQQRGTVGKNQH
jgi:hypothetical protein